MRKLDSLKRLLYKQIRCPTCLSETRLKYAHSKNIACKKCGVKYRVANGIPVLLSKESEVKIKKQLHSKFGNKMRVEYKDQTTFFGAVKKLFRVPDLSYDLVDRKKLHGIVTHDENPKFIILNIGGGPRREDGNVLNLNIGLFPNVEVVADAHNLPFKSNSLDGIMIIAALEHVESPREVVAEAYRVLKKNGYIYAETPFLQHFHGYPNHFQNFTLIGHDMLFKKFKKVESGPTTGPFSSVGILILNLFEDLIENKYLRKITMIFVAGLFYPFKFLDSLTKKNKNIYKLTNGNYYLGQKK